MIEHVKIRVEKVGKSTQKRIDCKDMHDKLNEVIDVVNKLIEPVTECDCADADPRVHFRFNDLEIDYIYLALHHAIRGNTNPTAILQLELLKDKFREYVSESTLKAISLMDK